MSLSAEIGWAVMEELAQYRGCDIQDIVIVEDDDIYGDIVDSIIDVIEIKLRSRAGKINELLTDWSEEQE